MASGYTTEQALGLWQRVLVANVRDEQPDLTLRQFALLLTVYMTPPPHTVRGLAHALAVSKPAVTRGLNRLEAQGLARRKRDPEDKRNVLVQRTVKGSVYLSDLAETISAASRDAMAPGSAALGSAAPGSAAPGVSGTRRRVIDAA